MEDHPIFEGERLAECERLGQQDVGRVEGLAYLLEGPPGPAASLADLEGQVVGVEAERDAGHAVDDRLDDVPGQLPVRHPPLAKVMLVIDREGQELSPP